MTIIAITILLTLLGMITPWFLKWFFPHNVCYREVAISTVLSLVIGGICFAIFTATVPRSTEIWNGMVTGKEKVSVPCSHRYCCSWTTQCTGTGETRSCRQVCARYCYRHNNDYDWRVYHNLGDRGYINIARLDSQGRREPPRWTAVEIGEPFSRENTYVDYLKVTDKSIFYSKNSNIIDEYESSIPNYPHVYDIYRTRLVVATHPVPSNKLNQWNAELRNALGTWGPLHQLNVIVVLTQHPRDFMQYMVNAWDGGRKNDAILFLNLNDDDTANWIDVFAWTQQEYFNSLIRSELNALDKIDIDDVVSTLRKAVPHFERIEMEEFRYLLRERRYAGWQILIMLILQLGGNVALGYFVASRSWFNNYRPRIRTSKFNGRFLE